MYDEFLQFKSKNKEINTHLDGNLRTIKKELDDLKYSGDKIFFFTLRMNIKTFSKIRPWKW